MGHQVDPVEILCKQETFKGQDWLVFLSQTGLKDKLERQILDVNILVEGILNIGDIALGGVNEVVMYLVYGPLTTAVSPCPLHVNNPGVEESKV